MTVGIPPAWDPESHVQSKTHRLHRGSIISMRIIDPQHPILRMRLDGQEITISEMMKFDMLNNIEPSHQLSRETVLNSGCMPHTSFFAQKTCSGSTYVGAAIFWKVPALRCILRFAACGYLWVEISPIVPSQNIYLTHVWASSPSWWVDKSRWWADYH